MELPFTFFGGKGGPQHIPVYNLILFTTSQWGMQDKYYYHSDFRNKEAGVQN